MKKQLLIALLATAGLLQAAHAADYVGLNIGRIEHKGTLDGLGSDKDSDVGYRLYYGHQITDTFGLELGYADLGKYQLSGGGYTIAAEPRSLQAALTATYPLNARFSLFGKAGFSRNRSRLSGTGLKSFKENDTNTLLGLGASFTLNQQISFVVEYENYSKVLNGDGVHLKTSGISGGVRYGF